MTRSRVIPHPSRRMLPRVRVLASLRSRNVRLFLAGQSVSLVGIWIQQVAMSWLVYRLTGSPLLLGLVGAAGQLPALLLMPVAGTFADRWSRRRILMVTQGLAMALTLGLAALASAGVGTVWHLVAINALLGLVGALDVPARQAFIADLVDDRGDLGNAIALHSAVTNAARLVGPSVGGALVAAAGEGICFLANSLSYAGVLVALCAIRVTSGAPSPETPIVAGLRATARAAAATRPIGAALALVALVTLLGRPYTLLLPVVAGDVLQGGPQMLGWLMAASGLGALVGTLGLSARRSLGRSPELIGIGATLSGTALILFAFSETWWLSLATMFATGLGVAVLLASSNAVIQTRVADDQRGRVMGLYTVAFVGLAPIGALVAGVVAAGVGAAGMLLLGGVGCVGGALVFGRRLADARALTAPARRA